MTISAVFSKRAAPSCLLALALSAIPGCREPSTSDLANDGQDGQDGNGTSDDGSPGDDPPALPELRTLMRAGPISGTTHTLLLRDAELFPPGFAMGIEADCGNGWTPTMLQLSAETPVAEYFEIGDIIPAPHGTHDAELLEAMTTLAELIDAYDELLAPYGPYYPEYACMEDPSCAAELEALDEALAELEAVVANLSDDSDPFALGEPVYTDPLCEFRGVYGDADKKFVPGKADPTYEDWDGVVDIEGDPCQGQTPRQCYVDLLDKYSKRICGEVDADGNAVANPPKPEDLPESCRSGCMAIKAGWVEFEELSCEPLPYAGLATRTNTPAAGGNGHHTKVRFDWSSFLRSAQSYATFKHELDHVAFNGTFPSMVQDRVALKKALNAQWQAKLTEAIEALKAKDFAASKQAQEEAEALQQQHEAACASIPVAHLDSVLLKETRAITGVLYNAPQVYEGSPVGGTLDGDAMELYGAKTVIASLAKRLADELSSDDFKDVTPSDNAAQYVCDELAKAEAFAKATTVPPLQGTMWDCSMKLNEGQLERDLAAVRTRLGCT